ncbi:unnamed protein product [Phytophthora fragariaefolia]|uniref:RNA-directed DNA polymerase n=1 Tax=Phytophthora fragariaefolia TaxID=1490495 RepID=A0A9W6TGP0_9STRA|nr:unnamed protein product [Phytophthora fragariaefolia]
MTSIPFVYRLSLFDCSSSRRNTAKVNDLSFSVLSAATRAPSPDDTAAQATADLAADAGATSNAGANTNLGNELRGKSPQRMTKRGACLGGSEAGDSDGSRREARSGSQEWLPACCSNSYWWSSAGSRAGAATPRPSYEGKILERCVATGEAHENVLVTIKSSIEPKILEHLAHYGFKTEVFALTEEALRAEIERRAGILLNDHVPDVKKMFADRLVMDTSKKDVHARVVNYFIAFDQLVEDNGLATWVGRGSVTDAAGQQRMKMRCKLLIANLAPVVLKVDIQRLASVTHRHVKHDDIALYELIVKRASLQQHYHQMQSDVKRSGSEKSMAAGLETKNKGAGIMEQTKKSASKEKTPTKPKGPVTPPTSGCLVCKGSHWVKDCLSAPQDQKAAALQAARDRKKDKTERVRAAEREAAAAGDSRRLCINGVFDVPFCPDTGADSNIISKTLVDELLGLGAAVELRKLSPLVKVQVAGGALMLCRSAVTLNLRIETAAGPLNLRNVPCLVQDGDEDEFLLGGKTMRDIGIDIDRLFEQLADGDRVNEADGNDVSDNDTELHFAMDMEDNHRHFDRMLDEAREAGFEPSLLEEFRALVYEYADVWRVHIGADPPAAVEPLVAQLRPGAQPYRSGTRKYPEPQRKFLREFVKELEKNGLVNRNNASRWACPALPVKKPHSDDFRCTMDYRPANKWTVALAGATPNLVIVIQSVKGAYAFGLFDLFKRFWQLSLHPISQELYSFVTEDGVFTPTRVPQGASDSATHFQLPMQDRFRDMLYDNLLVWIDDLLLFAKTLEEYLAKLREFFAVLRSRRLKLNAKKCLLFSASEFALPPTAAALQQFLCAANWLRDSMVDYARTVHPLQAKLEDVMARRGRRKSQLAGVDLTWTDEDKDAFSAVVDLLATPNKQHFADKDARVYLLTDASSTGWAIVVSQVRHWDGQKSVSEQTHELLVCRSGQCTGAQLNWSIIEKEAYPVVRACADLAYLLDRVKGFHIYCDHANLVYIFAQEEYQTGNAIAAIKFQRSHPAPTNHLNWLKYDFDLLAVAIRHYRRLEVST